MKILDAEPVEVYNCLIFRYRFDELNDQKAGFYNPNTSFPCLKTISMGRPVAFTLSRS